MDEHGAFSVLACVRVVQSGGARDTIDVKRS